MNWLVQPDVCPGLFYGTPARDGFLIRIRIAGGLLNQQQGKAIASVVDRLGQGTLQVTNRGNLQIRAVATAPSEEVFQTLQHLGLAAQNHQLDRLRNLMTSPTAGIDTQELIDTRPFVQALDTYIQSHPELAGLSAKFSIGIDGGGSVGIGTRSAIAWEHRYNEIQLSAIKTGLPEQNLREYATVAPKNRFFDDPNGSSNPNYGRVYFHLALGADKHLCDTQVLIAPEDCISVVGALAAVYLDYANQSPPEQKKRRMKHLLQDWGIATYLEKVERRLSRPFNHLAALSLPPTQPYAHLGVHPQGQIGLSYVGVSLPLGQLTVNQWRGLVQLSATFGTGHLCLTPWQSVLLPNLPHEQVAHLLHGLANLGLSAAATQPDTAIVACAGKPGCGASATETQPHALALADYLQGRFPEQMPPVNIHFTGCPKSCAQPSPAEITLLGTTIEQDGETVEGYRVYIGDRQQSLKYQLGDVRWADLTAMMERLLNLYQQHRKTPSESFGEFASRYPITNLISLVMPAQTSND